VVCLAAGFVLRWLRPGRLPGRRLVQRTLGWAAVAAGANLVAQSVRAAARVDLAHPGRVVTAYPYSISRNPMYVGWAFLHLGAGLIAGSGWIVATLPAAAGWMHLDVRREERRLAEAFGEDYERYRSAVPRYLTVSPWMFGRPSRLAGTHLSGRCLAAEGAAMPAKKPQGNGLVLTVLRSPAHRLLSGMAIELRYTGRRSGREFTLPVQYALDGRRLLVAVQSPSSTTWWRNFRTPQDVSVRLRGKILQGTAHVVSPDDPAWERDRRLYERRWRRLAGKVSGPLVQITLHEVRDPR